MKKIVFVRKGIKIKAYTIMLSWLMIFAHGIIPHVHPENTNCNCHEIVHSSGVDNRSNNHEVTLNNVPEDVTVCHFSSSLFNHFNGENLISQSDSHISVSPVILPGSIFYCTSDPFFSDQFNGVSCLRAPPAA